MQDPDFPPHILFNWSYHNNKTLFNRLFLGNMNTAQRTSMWQELLRRQDPRVVNHPMRELRAWDSRAVPLGIHGDGAPVLQVGKAGAKSYETYSLQSMLASGPTNEIKMLLFGIFGDNISESTMRVIWKRLTWSLYFLYKGVWPTVDWDKNAWTADNPTERRLAGTDLADGLFGVLMCLKGDLDYFT